MMVFCILMRLCTTIDGVAYVLGVTRRGEDEPPCKEQRNFRKYLDFSSRFCLRVNVLPCLAQNVSYVLFLQ